MLFIQYQAPVTGLLDQISSARSTSALRVMGRLNVTMIGMPTPNTWPVPRLVIALKVRRGVKVRNAAVVTLIRPRGFTAVAVTW